MATYTPTTNLNPTFGQSGETVRALQRRLNLQHAGKAGYVPLKEDALFGPRTQAALSFGQSNSGTPPIVPANDVGNVTPLRIPSLSRTPKNDNLSIQSQSVNNTPIPTVYSSQNKPGENRNILQDELYKLIGEQGKQSERTATLQEEHDIAGKSEALNKITGQIATKQRAYENKIREARKNLQGKFGGAVEQDISNLERQGNQELADLAILKSVALGDLDTANDIVDAKIKAEFEPIDNRIKALQTFYNLNLNDMSDQERFDLETRIDQEKALRNDLSSAKEYAYKQAIDAGAGASVLAKISAATTMEEAYAALTGVPGVAGGSGSGSGGKPSQVMINLGRKKLQESKTLGAEGDGVYVNPDVYKQAYDDWLADGYSSTAFLKEFPPDDWVNPANTWLPAYLRPKKSAGSREL